MKRPGFFEGAGVALALSLSGSVLFAALSPVIGNGVLTRLLIAGLGLAYVLYLLGRAPERVGRVTALAAWAAVASIAWLLAPSITLYALIHLGLVWLVRSLYFRSSLLTSLADLGLNGLALAAGIAALIHTGSLFLSLWSFFLVQALFVVIPPSIAPRTEATHAESDEDFLRAHRAAETALRRLSSTR